MNKENAQGEGNSHVGRNKKQLKKEIFKINNSTVNIIIETRSKRYTKNFILKFLKSLKKSG